MCSCVILEEQSCQILPRSDLTLWSLWPEEVAPNKNNKMSTNMRSVPGSKLEKLPSMYVPNTAIEILNKKCSPT